MKSILAMSLALTSLFYLAACETSLTPVAEQSSSRTLDVEATVVQAGVEQRIPDSALGSREAEVAGRQTFESTAAEIETAAPAIETNAAPIGSVDLSGNWLLTLPAGYQYRVTMEALGDDRYRLQTTGSFRGVYQLNGDVLQVVEPSNERLNVFDWQLHNINSMTLVDETGASGARYAGATMGRQIEWDDAGLPRQITAIGRPAVPRPANTTRASAIRAATPTARQVTLIGTAFNDEERGPYLETDETIVFITGLDAWPADTVGQTVTVRGMMRPFVIQDDGETLRAQQLNLESWSRSDKVESIEEESDSEIPATVIERF